MSARSDSRNAYFYDLRLKVVPEVAPANDPPNFKAVLESACGATLRTQDAHHSFAIRSLQMSGNVFLGLATYADRRVSTPALEDITTGEVLSVDTTENEWPAYSAHFAISASPDQRGGFLMVLEAVPLVSRSRIVGLLDEHVRRETVFDFAGKTTNRQARWTLHAEAHADPMALQNLNNSRVQQFTLVQRNRLADSYDGASVFTRTETALVLKPLKSSETREVTPARLLADADRIMKAKHAEYSFARIALDRSALGSETVVINDLEDGIALLRMTRRAKIAVPSTYVFEQAHDQPCEQVLSALERLVRENA